MSLCNNVLTEECGTENQMRLFYDHLHHHHHHHHRRLFFSARTYFSKDFVLSSSLVHLFIYSFTWQFMNHLRCSSTTRGTKMSELWTCQQRACWPSGEVRHLLILQHPAQTSVHPHSPLRLAGPFWNANLVMPLDCWKLNLLGRPRFLHIDKLFLYRQDIKYVWPCR